MIPKGLAGTEVNCLTTAVLFPHTLLAVTKIESFKYPAGTFRET